MPNPINRYQPTKLSMKRQCTAGAKQQMYEIDQQYSDAPLDESLTNRPNRRWNAGVPPMTNTHRVHLGWTACASHTKPTLTSDATTALAIAPAEPVTNGDAKPTMTSDATTALAIAPTDPVANRGTKPTMASACS